MFSNEYRRLGNPERAVDIVTGVRLKVKIDLRVGRNSELRQVYLRALSAGRQEGTKSKRCTEVYHRKQAAFLVRFSGRSG